MAVNRQIQPALNEIRRIELPAFENVKLDNGIPVHILNVGSQDLVKIQISIPAGSIYQKQFLIAFFTNKMLKEGSKNYSAAQIAERMDFYGAFFDTNSGRDHAYFTVFCLNKYLDPILGIVQDILTAPLWSTKELQVLKQQEKQAFQIRNTKTKTLANRKFHEMVFGEKHPYGAMANLEDYDAVEAASLDAFFQTNYQPKYWNIFVSGKTSSQTISILNHHFGHLVSSEAVLSQINILQPEVRAADYFIEQKDALQTSLKMGAICIKRNHKNYPVLALAQTILGGFFGSRLMQNIREDKGYTYGIHSGIQHLKYSSVFMISSELRAEFAQQALEEVKKELKRLREDAVKADELHLVKNYMSGNLLRSLNGPFALGDIMRMLLENDLDRNYFNNYIAGIQTATAEDILQIAHSCLNEEKMISVLVGPLT